MTPEEALATFTTTCAACDKGLIKPYQESAFSSARAERDPAIRKDLWQRVAKFREGVSVHTSALGLPGSFGDVIVCPGRTERVPSEVCHVQALKKVARCPVCGGEKDFRHRWPLPCSRCTTYAEEGYRRDALDAERGDKEAVFIHTYVDGLWAPSYDDGRLSAVMSGVFAAFGVETPQQPTTKTVGWRDATWNDPEGLKLLLDTKQIEAVTRLFRWLNLATAKARADALREGTDLLRKLVRGEITMDALNDIVGERAQKYQATADKIREGEK